MALKTWAIRGSVVAVLAATAALGRGVTHDRPAEPLDLGGKLAGIGEWRCVEVGEAKTEADGTAVKQTARYENKTGNRLQVAFVTAATRLGALRDYSVALEAQGWVLYRTETVEGPTLAHLGQPMRACLESLRRDGTERLALSWFVSSRRQARNLSAAELGGWWDLLTQLTPPPWVQVFVTVDVDKSTPDARRTLLNFADAMGPELAGLVSEEGQSAHPEVRPTK